MQSGAACFVCGGGIEVARSIALKLSLPAVLLALSVSLVSISPYSVADALKLTAGQLSALLKDPSIKVSATSTVVSGTGPAVTVLADEKDKATDQDLKIDAVFLSKALVDRRRADRDGKNPVFQPARNRASSRLAR